MKNALAVNVKTFAINTLIILLYYVILLLVC